MPPPLCRVLIGDARAKLAEFEPETVQMVCTSPPYFGLRDYGVDGQMGLEETPAAYVEGLVAVFELVRRALRKDGTIWVNLGDTHARARHGNTGTTSGLKNVHRYEQIGIAGALKHRKDVGLRRKNLLGMPWRFALAMQDAGWVLRSDIIWHKPNPVPESVLDRPTRAHEYVFLFSKSRRYFYDVDAVRTPQKAPGEHARGANARSVWTIASTPYAGEHHAAFPRELPRRCILAGSRPGDLVLDPFAGTGTVLEQALVLGRCALGIELSPAYGQLIDDRLRGIQLSMPISARPCQSAPPATVDPA